MGLPMGADSAFWKIMRVMVRHTGRTMAEVRAGTTTRTTVAMSIVATRAALLIVEIKVQTAV